MGGGSEDPQQEAERPTTATAVIYVKCEELWRREYEKSEILGLLSAVDLLEMGGKRAGNERKAKRIIMKFLA